MKSSNSKFGRIAIKTGSNVITTCYGSLNTGIMLWLVEHIAEFGPGAEIRISTQKLHPRGPIALEALTTYKWIIKGNGQVRP